jgi:hypothetical protein
MYTLKLSPENYQKYKESIKPIILDDLPSSNNNQWNKELTNIDLTSQLTTPVLHKFFYFSPSTRSTLDMTVLNSKQ